MKFKKLALIPLVTSFSCGCTSYTSHYKAFLLIQSSSKSEANVSFDQFEGQMVFKLKKATSGEGSIFCDASLKEGTVKVALYSPLFNNESELFSLNSGESISEYRGYIESNQKYIIILRSSSPAREGKFEFKLD